MTNKMKNEKILHYRNNSKIKYQNRRKELKWIPLTHIYMTAHFPGLVHRHFYQKWRNFKSSNIPFSEMRVKCVTLISPIITTF